MKYYIYKTTNLINGKIYIGLHKSENIETDKYIGTGWAFTDAVNKYGRENFKREILFEFDTLEEANAKEYELVNEEFVNRDDNYNLRTGGNVGTMSEETKKRLSEALLNSEAHKEAMMNPDRCKKVSDSLKGKSHSWQDKINKNPVKIRKMAEKHRGMKRSDDAKKNMSESLKGKYMGDKNPCFRGYWVTPFGKFDSLNVASDTLKISVKTIRERCILKNNNTVKTITINNEPRIDKTMLGKTWAELGWSFEPGDRKNV